MISILEATKPRVPDGIEYPCKGREVTELLHRPLSEVVPAGDRKYRRHSCTQLLWNLFPLHSSQGPTNLLPEPGYVASALFASTSPPVRPGCCPGNAWGRLCFWHRLSLAPTYAHSGSPTLRMGFTHVAVITTWQKPNSSCSHLELRGDTYRQKSVSIRSPMPGTTKNTSLSTQVPHLSVTQTLLRMLWP